MSFLPLLDSVSYYKYMVISKTGQAKIFFEKGSILGLVVESQCFMLDGLFSHLFVVKIVLMFDTF